VNRATQGALLLVVGYVTTFLATFGGYLAFLRAGMRLPMSAAGLMLVILGAVTIWPAVMAYLDGDDHHPDAHDAEGGPVVGRDHRRDSPYDHGSAHHVPWVGWLFLLPPMAMLLVPPTSLGADAARRDIGRSAPPPGEVEFSPLPAPTDGAVELPVSTFVARARYDLDHGMAGVPIRMTGFVVRDPAMNDGYLLTRFALVCCAADAYASQVEIQDLAGPPPPDDTWVEVVGEWIAPSDGDARGIGRSAALRVSSQAVVEAPENPYE
jgi:uncharacterized repeat protein (TIGR03943 family)